MIKELTIFLLFLYSIFRNAWIAMQSSFGTIALWRIIHSAPEESRIYRDLIYMDWENCLGCFKCAVVCPAHCIYINSIPALPKDDLGITSDGQRKVNWVLEFDIDMSKCLHCMLCTYPCPTQCIVMTHDFNSYAFHRANLIYHFTPFTPELAYHKSKELNMK